MLAGLLLLPTQIVAQTVTIGTAETYEAGQFTVAPAALNGFEKALGDALCERAKLTCEWKAMARDDLMSALRKHEVDAVMAAIPTSAALGKGVEMTAPYLYPDPFVFVGAPGTEMHMSVRTVAAVGDPAIKAWAPSTGHSFKYFGTLEEAVNFVTDGHAEAVLGEQADLEPLIEASGGRLAVISPRPIHLRPGLAMALREGDSDLRFTFEDRIYDMSQDGSLNALTKKWFGGDASQW